MLKVPNSQEDSVDLEGCRSRTDKVVDVHMHPQTILSVIQSERETLLVSIIWVQILVVVGLKVVLELIVKHTSFQTEPRAVRIVVIVTLSQNIVEEIVRCDDELLIVLNLAGLHRELLTLYL